MELRLDRLSGLRIAEGRACGEESEHNDEDPTHTTPPNYTTLNSEVVHGFARSPTEIGAQP